ncbi:MAG: arsenite methyltransferase [Acholeplasmataceae bacterium]|jgi:SAM-dependent methyltransferase|nr:arsenite methyltransferase [Acholeplasmataceae bacterium]
MNEKNLRGIVKEKYGTLASQSNLLFQQGCCGPSNCCGELEISMIGDEYNGVEGYNPNADLGLGCGLPTEFAQIKKGVTVVDLGSGAGNDCFVARALVGETGRVIGIDMTKGMIEKARKNNLELGYKNIEFLLGEIEELPLPDNTADVVISNCVLNLVPNKVMAFSEIHRVLKPGGHFSISDVVVRGKLPEKLRQDAEMYVGCVAGAMEKETYLNIIRNSGLINITVQKEKQIPIPDETLLNYLGPQGLEDYQKSGNGIFSITVYAEKN